jgi:succinate dehydrogenase flavin-adding protein (antitoxin of CptAB toxin-antitoxin module)
MERQLKEFQSLLQQKDEQIAQLMEEGKLQNVK